MKSNVKIMLFGITLILFGIYLRNIFVGYLSNLFLEAVWTVIPIVGIITSLYGFFLEDK